MKTFLDYIPKGLPTALVLVIVLVLTLMPADSAPQVGIPYIDKVVHFIMFGTLSASLLFDVARIKRCLSWKLYFIVVTICCAVGVLDELLQGTDMIGRGAEVADALADFLGAFVLPLVLLPFRRWITGDSEISFKRIRSISEIPITVYNAYVTSFPIDEQRPWENIVKLLSDDNRFHIYVLYSLNKPVGMITYWNLGHGLYIEHFVIVPTFRNRGLGRRTLEKLCNDISPDVVLKVEPPSEGVTAQKRIGFYERAGFKLHGEYVHIQPPYSTGRKPVELRLMTYGYDDVTSYNLSSAIIETAHKSRFNNI